MARFLHNATVKTIFVSALIATGLQAQAQDSVRYTRPTWMFGVAGGANFNFYRGTTQQLNDDLTVPAAFHHGKGVGLYVAPVLEYHRPNTRLGFILQVGYDSRKGKFDQVVTPCDCKADLKTDLRYTTIEPSLRFAPFKSDFYLFGGPRFAFNMAKSFTYVQKVNEAFPEQLVVEDVTADFSRVNKNLISMQIGAGYDIQLSSQEKETQYVLSPFVSYQPYFGQDARSIETWTLTTVRVGAALKFGRGHKIDGPVKAVPLAIVDPTVKFSVNSPENISVDRRVRETFPLRNYIFFDLGSNEIPDRYVLLRKDQVKDFKEDQLEVFAPKKLSGRSDREMIVYYNVLNILGDRMGKSGSSKIHLRGNSMSGKDIGKDMAEQVKNYLVTIFAISPDRITTEGGIKPLIPSEQPGGTKELDLLREGDNRVTISSASPEMLMEFQSGYDIPLKPVELRAVQSAPVDSYVTVKVAGAEKAFSSWNLEVKDEKGVQKNFGPYFQEEASIPGKSILNERPEGNYKVTMVGVTQNGKTIRKDTTVHMVLWKESEREEGMRYSVIYEIRNSSANDIYTKYLTEVVAPTIMKNATVILHGHTDIIGEEAENIRLSLARANDVRSILEKAMANAGRTDVKFEVRGFGEDESLAPFENNFPEERFYNRTVIIDIIPPKK